VKSELRLAEHASIHGAVVVEVWYGGEFIASVYGADGPGVRVISKHRLYVDPADPRGSVGAVTVQVGQ
jgi:hypothetical protein